MEPTTPRVLSGSRDCCWTDRVLEVNEAKIPVILSKLDAPTSLAGANDNVIRHAVPANVEYVDAPITARPQYDQQHAHDSAPYRPRDSQLAVSHLAVRYCLIGALMGNYFAAHRQPSICSTESCRYSTSTLLTVLAFHRFPRLPPSFTISFVWSGPQFCSIANTLCAVLRNGSYSIVMADT
jgi:hypothetical protein